MLYYDVNERILAEGEFIVENSSTVRATAAKFGVSKSTVHKDLSYKLKYLDEALFNLVEEVLQKNLSERHLRGGVATKLKYLARKIES
ncbi:MAG TPA: stage III sporulation protein D [Clostridiales bacterium]|mgnify:CR=1 FL=1|nr:stage III sporulation protein D [Clostridiales bacterium]